MAARKFMDEVRFAMRSAQLSYRTEQSYCAVIRRFVLFHGRRYPAELGASEVALYLTALAEEQRVSASTQHVALCALTFLYRVVLAQPLPSTWPSSAPRPPRGCPSCLPVLKFAQSSPTCSRRSC